jgi:enamine deaminase RidA (YjgF/YER057c/UK114 family)
MKALLPPGWPRPKGYSNGIAASGRFVFTGGVVGWDQQERFPLDTLVGQFEQTLRNIVAILAEGRAAPEHIVRMTCYVTSVDDYLASLKDIGAAWKGVIGAHYPTMALVEVVRLVEREAKVEIEATAVVPE